MHKGKHQEIPRGKTFVVPSCSAWMQLLNLNSISQVSLFSTYGGLLINNSKISYFGNWLLDTEKIFDFNTYKYTINTFCTELQNPGTRTQILGYQIRQLLNTIGQQKLAHDLSLDSVCSSNQDYHKRCSY